MSTGPVPAADCLTADGKVVRVRTVTAADGPALLALHEGMSVHNRYLRFFSAGAALDVEVRRLTRPADDEHVALLVEHGDAVVAAGSYERINAEQADFALIVDDAHHGEGLGTLVLEHLAAAARRQGVAELVGDVLADNRAMLRVSGGLAPGVPRTFADPGVVQVRIPTLPDEAALAAVGERDRTAAHHSLRPLLAPASVAVIGAGRRPGGAGHEILAALVAGGYDGDLYAVNPRARDVCGLPSLPSVTLVGEPIDLAVVAVPPSAAAEVVRDCCAVGVRAAVILTSGLDETMRADLVRMARRHGMRLVGPDSLGVLNTDPAVRLTAAFAGTLPPPGGLAVASQSGAVGVAILEAAAQQGIGVSSFVSLGDKADVSGNDLLAYWHDDPATRAVALYLESFGNPRRFAWVARALGRRKPVLAVKSGRRGTAANVAVEALFEQAGVIRTDTLGDLLDTARVLVDQPPPGGDRLAVIGNTRGLTVLAVDAAVAAGLAVPAFSAAVTDRIRRLPGGGPVVLDAAALAGAVRVVAACGEADMLVVTFAATRATDAATVLRALAAAVDEAPDLPVAVVVVGAAGVAATLGRRKVPVYRLPEPAVHAFGRAARYAAWRREPLGGRPALAGVDRAAARAVVRDALDGGGGWQPDGTTRRLLRAYGITVLDARPGGAPGVDLVAGVVHDPLFGSLVTIGGGPDPLSGPPAPPGSGDRVPRLLPLTDRDAATMWRSLRCAPLLTGERGGVAADPASLEDVLLRLGRLAGDLPEVAELELDPVVAGPAGCAVLGARLRLSAVGTEPDPYLRDLLIGPGTRDEPEGKA